MDAAPVELALWREQPIDVAVESYQIDEIFPTIAVSDDTAVIEFRIAANSDTALDLLNTTFRCGYKIVDASDTAITAGTKVSLTNIPLHASLSRVDITLGGESLTSGSTTNYPYKAFIEMIVNGATNDNEALAAGLTADTPNGMNTLGALETGTTLGANPASKNRLAWNAGGKTVTFEGSLFADVCRQNKYIPMVREVCIRLHQSADAFRLMAADSETKYRLKLVKPVLRVRNVRLTPQGIREFAINRSSFKLPIKNHILSTYNIPSGVFSHYVDAPFGGRVPTRLVVAFIAADAFQGKYELNPFNFQHFDVSEMSFTLDGRSIPGPPVETDYSGNDYVTPYRTLTSSVFPTRIPIARPYVGSKSMQYFNGYCFTVFALNGERNTGELKTPAIFGITRFIAKFKVALAKAVTLILYATFDDELEIPL